MSSPMPCNSTAVAGEGAPAKPRGGFVLYPRHYHIDHQDPGKSFVRGARYDGSECVVRLRPTYVARSNARDTAGASVPTLARFAETHRRARTPCFATPKNARGGEGGVLLMEQVSLDSKASREHGGVPVYTAKWASVLREGADMPDPVIGFGYLETGFAPKLEESARALQGEIDLLRRTMLQSGPTPEMTQQLQAKLAEQLTHRRKWFAAVVMEPRDIATYASPTKAQLAQVLHDVLVPRTDHGRYGMALLRVRDGDRVLAGQSAQVKMDYDFSGGFVKPYEEIFDEFLKFGGGAGLISILQRDPKLSLDVIPAQRINCRRSDAVYADQLMVNDSGNWRPGKVLRTYVDQAYHTDFSENFHVRKAYLYAKVAVRIARATGSGLGNDLMSSIHAFSAPIGNAYCIGQTGQPVLTLDRGIDELAHPREAGLSAGL